MEWKRFMLVAISILIEFGLDFVENILSNDHAVFCNKCYVWQWIASNLEYFNLKMKSMIWQNYLKEFYRQYGPS